MELEDCGVGSCGKASYADVVRVAVEGDDVGSCPFES